MPLGATTFGNGGNGDPLPPSLSITTYSSVCDLIRKLSHTYGNTTVITDAEILTIVLNNAGEIARANWEKMQPYYLQTNTFNVGGSSNPYTVNYSTLSPYMDKFVGSVFLSGRKPIKIVGADELQRASKLTTMYANSILGTVYDGYMELFVGSSITNPQDYTSEIYYYRQPQLAGITTSNYSTKYVDLPDSYIPQLVYMSVSVIERTKQ